jgi:hypothetical protein
LYGVYVLHAPYNGNGFGQDWRSWHEDAQLAEAVLLFGRHQVVAQGQRLFQVGVAFVVLPEFEAVKDATFDTFLQTVQDDGDACRCFDACSGDVKGECMSTEQCNEILQVSAMGASP